MCYIVFQGPVLLGLNAGRGFFKRYGEQGFNTEIVYAVFAVQIITYGEIDIKRVVDKNLLSDWPFIGYPLKGRAFMLALFLCPMLNQGQVRIAKAEIPSNAAIGEILCATGHDNHSEALRGIVASSKRSFRLRLTDLLWAISSLACCSAGASSDKALTSFNVSIIRWGT